MRVLQRLRERVLQPRGNGCCSGGGKRVLQRLRERVLQRLRARGRAAG